MGAIQSKPMSEFTSGEWAAYETCRWIKANYGDFKKLISLVDRQVKLGNPCVKQGEIELYVRESGITFDLGDEFKHNRNLYPGITRYMVMLYPWLARSLNFRKSKLDDVDLAGMWHRFVNGGTTFLADSRYMAQHLVDIGDACAR